MSKLVSKLKTLSQRDLQQVSYDTLTRADNISCSLIMPEFESCNSSRFSNEFKLQAVAVFSITGIIKLTARVMGVVDKTIRDWSKTEWWTDCENQVILVNSNIFNARTANLINQAFDSVEKRLENGDFANFDDDGNPRLKPVSAKDSAVIAGIMFDKQRINNALCNNITQVNHTHLIDIKGQFEGMSAERVIQGEIE